VFSAIIIGIMLSGMAFAALPALAQSDGQPVNVRDFGAKGDNVTDDTLAIQAAIDAAQKAHPWPEIYFPAGTYRISDTLKIYSANIRGRSVTLMQLNPEKDIMYYDFSWRVTIEGMTFKGGAKQLNLGNNFVDQGLIRIVDCRFIDSNDFAIYLDRRSHATHLVIRDCVFSQCMQALYTVADWTTMSDSWITSHVRMQNKAVLVNKGVKLVCENILAVPLVNGLDQRWVDNYGDVTLRNFRAGGEGGGFTPIVNFAKDRLVVLEDSCVWADGNLKRNCAVYCEQPPGGLYIRNNYLAVPPVRFAPGIDLKKTFAHIPEGMLQYDVMNNYGPFMDDAESRRIIRAVEKRDKSLPPIAGAMTPRQVKAALANAVEAVKALPAETQEKPYESSALLKNAFKFTPHTQQLDPAKYVDIPFNPKTWDLNQRMDNQLYMNSQFVALAPVGDDVVMLRSAPGLHPHIAIRYVAIDLDKTPVLSWKLKDPGIDMRSGHAIKIVQEETNQMRLLLEHNYPDFFYDYNAVDLREAFGLKGGVHRFTIRFYVLANDCTKEDQKEAGDYLILDFLRAEQK
jgi:hypothetical protein